MGSPNNYISKNLKTLRQQIDVTQEVFGELFNLSRNNVRSYEGGTEMKIDKLMEIVIHFNLDFEKFVGQDMTLHNVYKLDEDEGKVAVIGSKVSDFVSTSERFKYLDDFSKDKLKKMYKALTIEKEILNSELDDCRKSLIKLQQKLLEKAI